MVPNHLISAFSTKLEDLFRQPQFKNRVVVALLDFFTAILGFHEMTISFLKILAIFRFLSHLSLKIA